MKQQILVLSIFLTYLLSFGQNDCTKGDCINGYGEAKIVNEPGATYEGYWKDGLRNGEGVFIDASGNSFSGLWVNDSLYGIVLIKWTDGRNYHGEYFKEKLIGFGELRWKDGAVYKGEFKSGRFDGFGTLTTRKGEERSGFWENGNLMESESETKTSLALKEKFGTTNIDSLYLISKEAEPIKLQEEFLFYFGFNSSVVKKEDYDMIRSFQDIYASNKEVSIDLVGHTCDIGSSDFNQRLGLARATNLYKLLINNNIPKEIITLSGVGENESRMDNSNDNNRKENRCVVAIISFIK